jgi:hypothetical protein
VKIPLPEEVKEALEDSQQQMHEMNERLERVEGLLVEIRDALVAQAKPARRAPLHEVVR